jgi:DNA-directed RNA polymerase specialized sigma24 family protein
MQLKKKGERPDDSGTVENVLLSILKDLPESERELLRRFYLLGHSSRQICRDLKLSNAQFLEIKRRAREKYDAARKAR